MKKKAKILFPFKDWIYIFQTLEYDRGQFMAWIKQNWHKRDLEKKKQLVKTPKVILLSVISIVLLILDVLMFYFIVSKLQTSFWFNLVVLIILFFFFLQVFFIYLYLAALIMAPLEKTIKRTYIQRARRKIKKSKNLTVIGIAGSYGKTSVKDILCGLLKDHFKVLKTPENVNTILGVSQLILKDLKEDHQVLIVEMGAYKKGEIKALCNLVKPKIGILTGITEQHLERFRSLENIIQAKSELINMLPKNGLALLNVDDQNIQKIKFNVELQKITYSVDWPSDFQAQKIKVSERGSQFTLSPDRGEVNFETRLLGKHNILNCLPGLYVANHLGIDWKILSSTLSQINPLPHRLEILDSNTDVTIIDDAYSSNPRGFKAALEMLKEFKDRRKILITPGIVELGEKEGTIHQELGKMIGDICEAVILIGKNTRTDSLVKGLEKSRFDMNKVKVVEDLTEAQKIIAESSKPGDVLLFENDLPDQY